MSDNQKIVNVVLDEKGVLRRNAEIEHERAVAIYDLLEDNRFSPAGDFDGPYSLHIGILDNRLVFDVRNMAEEPLTKFTLPVISFKTIIRDYFTICGSYFEAIKTKTRSQIEAIDMGRRGLHNEGAERLRSLLEEKVEVDNDTARRLFTLVCVLHAKG
ncbi:MAG: UPF0262 family protein [Rhodospirillales bacterium]|nr:UPF0262 family protein [Rhodospirillales bacterium]MCW8862491.1 UPF0262 family protein [Rhodospirillales bacterium]MCW8951734.1 UPF0262 family protein [Rhodospirillales bacterium]MCW8971299.1 UPF0262 family protein [Rhodospirillales bacterium]MCW9003314.1 UPF0262 family protein [Rhodospirillales bacterium]